MKNSKHSIFFKKHGDKVAVFSVGIACFILALTGFFQRFDLRLYDLLLSLRKSPEERQEILFVEIDNKSIDDLGVWPWSRDILANVLFRMKELGAQTAVFDIEYLSPSNLGINPEAQNQIYNAFENQKNDVNELINQFAGAALSGSYSQEELNVLADDIVSEWVNPGLDQLRDEIYQKAYQDNDELFAKAIDFFENAWLTINILELDIKYENEYLDYVRKKCLFSNVEDKKQKIKEDNDYYLIDQGGDNRLGFCPAQKDFMQGAKGAGFTNVVLDSDGTRRRVELLSEQNGSYVAQLVFAPILKILNPKKIERNYFTLKLIDATDPTTGELKNISIPLDSHGRMLINWINKEFENSFRRESVIMLYQLDETERKIISQLESLGGFMLWDNEGQLLPYYQIANELLNNYSEIKQYKQYLLEKCKGTDENGNPLEGILPEEYEDYFNARKAFFEDVNSFVKGEYFDQMFARLKEMKNEIANYDETHNALLKLFDTLRNEEEIYLSTFQEKQKAYEGSFCIIGNTASSTTDLGTTPFNRAYPNVGTHANVYNTIMNENFIWEINWIFGALAALVFAYLAVVLTKEKSAFTQNTVGILSIAISVGSPVFLMCFLQIYVPVMAPLLISVVSYIIVVILRFLTAEKDKGVLRNAFSTYLAPAVVEQIVKDPSKLKLGGEEKHMTALFSDIKSFSSFSELVTPSKLVSVLNDYLGSMSDKILDEGGTIDKYIGDSIVAFFGAPFDLENSAWSACVSAIRMKQMEDEFNRINIANGNIPMELKTRIGINTGEMVVGNMGTSSKMNYTIMGDAVNVASRLEGVNKVYKSWILCSDSTWKDANALDKMDLLVARRLDKVRVVGKSESIQLWNILGFKNELSEKVLESVEIYNQAMEKYEENNFKEAGKLFIKANKLVDEDETPLVFAQRCKEFIEKGVPKNWDGVVNMTSK